MYHLTVSIYDITVKTLTKSMSTILHSTSFLSPLCNAIVTFTYPESFNEWQEKKYLKRALLHRRGELEYGGRFYIYNGDTMGVPNNGPRIIRFEIACTSAWRTYRLHGVRIILRDRDSGVSQDLDWGRHTPRLACHHFNYIHPAQLSPSTTASCTPWLSSNR